MKAMAAGYSPNEAVALAEIDLGQIVIEVCIRSGLLAMLRTKEDILQDRLMMRTRDSRVVAIHTYQR